jgi:prolyl-tRNA synthetase
MGHVFRLGRLYSETFEARVLDAEGQQRVPVMGCYGIGVDRIVAAAVEAHHDEAGMAWPASIAPFDVHLVGLGLHRDAELSAAAEELYGELRMAGLEVLYDDRDESAGVKFNDADLIGIPLRMTVSPRNHRAGVVEIVQRTAATPAEPEQIERDAAVYKARELQGEARAALDPEV